MKTSIVVIDTPNNCQDCPLNKDCFCHVSGNCVLKYADSRPNWCPLKEIPEKYENISCDGSSFYHMCVGWNNCVDEILGGSNDSI